MPLIGGAIMPHGALILDPHRSEMSDTLKNASKNLNDACLAAAAAIEANKPDLILLYTPHGLIADGADMHIYTNSSASGSAEWMGSWSEHRVAVKCDTQAAQSLITHLKNDGCSAAALCAFSGYDAPLRWGEAVPLSFLRKTTAADGAKFCILSHGPSSTGERCEKAQERLKENEQIGASIAHWANSRDERVLLLISGDLAHTHGNERAPTLADGMTSDPRYLNPKYPSAFEEAKVFESKIIQGWIRSEHFDTAGMGVLLKECPPLLPRALCCGYEGFVILASALKWRHLAVTSSPRIQPKLLAHEVPVYFGMLIATFLPPEPDEPQAKRQRANASTSTPDALLAAPPTLPPRMASLDFVGRSVLVSGAGHGFGRTMALAFASLGAKVSACDGPGEAASVELASTAQLAKGLRGSMRVTRVDFRSTEAVTAWVQDHAQIDILVLNAGGVLGHTGSPVEEATLEAWEAIFDVNARAAFVACRAAAPALKRSENGRIITISSGAGLRPSMTGIHAYCAAKHALVGLTKQLALELGQHGVTVNSIAPGFCRTNPASEAQWRAYGEAKQQQILGGIFMRRLGTAEDISDAALFFASDAARWVTGQVLSVDGGKA